MWTSSAFGTLSCPEKTRSLFPAGPVSMTSRSASTSLKFSSV